MGYSWICGTCDAATQQREKELVEKILGTEPNIDGTIQIEIIIKGKSEKRVEFIKQNAEELKTMLNINAK